jgi:hypothetical protein
VQYYVSFYDTVIMAVTFDATLCSSRRPVIRRSLRSKTERVICTSDPSVCDIVSAAIPFIGFS